jgi:hypothetical protein
VPAPTGNDSNQTTLNTFREGDAMIEKLSYVLRAAFGDTNYPAARQHWLTYGIAEGRRASREFDAPFYLARHPDLVAAFGATNYGAALDHWLGYGINEGRRSAADFDIHAYLHRYPDLIAAFGDTNHGAALFHWLTYGAGEGRNAAP